MVLLIDTYWIHNPKTQKFYGKVTVSDVNGKLVESRESKEYNERDIEIAHWLDQECSFIVEELEEKGNKGYVSAAYEFIDSIS